MLTGSPRELATGHGELPVTSESSAQALDMQVGALWEQGVSCPAETHLMGIQDYRALGHFPLPRWEDKGTAGLPTVTCGLV